MDLNYYIYVQYQTSSTLIETVKLHVLSYSNKLLAAIVNNSTKILTVY